MLNRWIIYFKIISSLLAIGSIIIFSLLFYKQISIAIIIPLLIAIFFFFVIAQTSYLLNVRNRLIGFIDFDPNYKVEKNRAIWAPLDKSLCYLGISTHTFFPLFASWVKSLPNNKELYLKFLVINPDNYDLIKELILFRHDSNIDPEDIEKKIIEDQDRIRHHIKCLKNLNIGKKLITIEVRVYDTFVPWWMFISDETKVYLGLLPKGQDGINAPLLNFKINTNKTTIASSYLYFWEQLWRTSKTV